MKFLNLNQNILVLPADKGGKRWSWIAISIMKKWTNIWKRIYDLHDDSVRQIIEKKYELLRLELNKCFKIDEEKNFPNLTSPINA